MQEYDLGTFKINGQPHKFIGLLVPATDNAWFKASIFTELGTPVHLDFRKYRAVYDHGLSETIIRDSELTTVELPENWRIDLIQVNAPF